MNITRRTVLAISIASILSGSALAKSEPSSRSEKKDLATQSVENVTDDHPLRAQIVTFEEATLPDHTFVEGEGSIELSQTRYIHGNQSVKWNYQPDSPLVINKEWKYYTPKEASEAYGRGANTVFSIWIYNEKPNQGQLKFQFGGVSNSHFDLNLNFSGWRTIALAFHRDMQGMPSSTLQGVKITPVNLEQGGQLYIDRAMVSIDDVRYQWADDLVTAATVKPEIKYELPIELPKPTEQELAATETVKQQILQYYVGDMKVTNKVIKSLKKAFESYQIKKHDGVITGRHVVSSKQFVIYQPPYLSADDHQQFKEYVDVRDYSNVMQEIARAYHATQDGQVRQEMRDMYVLMNEHLLDQGFQDGASLGTTHHWGYSSRGWYSSMLMMEKVLEEEGLLKKNHAALQWFSREFDERGFGLRVTEKSSDMDYYNTLARAHAIMLLLEPEPDRRVALMHKFSEFLSNNIAQVPVGYGDGFRPDGTAWRHKGNYPGYSFAAMEGAGHIAYLLRGTPYELSVDARETLKKSLLAARIYANPTLAIGTNGRRPLHGTSLNRIADGMMWLAIAGDAQGQVDKELAAAQLRIVGKTKAQSKAIYGLEIEPEAHPQGSWTFNYAAMGIHRYGDKMVTMKGWNKYVWSSEIYRNANRYGRYQSHGSAQIHPWADGHDLGFHQNGWDWNRAPGATGIHLPLDLLESPRRHTLMLTNSSKFSGATSLDGKYSAFGFTLENPDRFAPTIDPSFTAKKSIYGFDNRLVFVGSTIANGQDQYHTETTLFQHGITELAKDLYVNGERITEFPYHATLKQGDWLIDGMGNGYYVVSGGEVHVQRQHQESRHNINKKPTSGDVASAWIDHGKAPKAGEYEYIVVLDATPEKMAALAEKMQANQKPYHVLRKDSSVHIVQDHETGVTGYTVYEFARISDQWIRSVNSSSMLMAKEHDGVLSLSVANPDINISKSTTSRSVPVSVTLNGHWQFATQNDQVVLRKKGSKTVATFNCIDGLPIQAELKRI